MLDPASAQFDTDMFDPNEEHSEGHSAERGLEAGEGGETPTAGRPRLICIGFAVIRI